MYNCGPGPIKACSAALGVFALLALSAPAAKADFWGYSPYTGSSNWFWLNRSLLSPIGLFGSGTGYSAPAYLAGTAAWTAGTALSRGVLGRQYQGDYRAYRQQAGVIASNQNGQNPARKSNPEVVDQITYLRPAGATKPADAAPSELSNRFPFDVPGAPGVLGAPDLAGGSGPAGASPDVLVPQGGSAPAIAIATASAQPPTAPDFLHPDRLVSNDSAITKAAESPAALQSLFLKHLLLGYQGDIVKAMQDKEMSRLALENGLNVEHLPAKLTNSEKAMIRKILADEKETPQARLVALRLILRQ